ncbi:hypothetical protein HanIR_Chr01g0024021 [Helianthus annuus]|nr:hypothetical protein HanIR_Chr01g0024021 [Helianthus annuus]
MTALAVHKNGRPRMMGTFSSASISRTTKSTGKTNLSTLTRRFSIMPRGYLTDLSASDKDMRVGDNSPRPNLSYKEYGIRFILAPRSARALHSVSLLNKHGMVKRPGSVNFSGTLFNTTAEHPPLRGMLETSPNLSLRFRRSFRNFAYFGID